MINFRCLTSKYYGERRLLPISFLPVRDNRDDCDDARDKQQEEEKRDRNDKGHEDPDPRPGDDTREFQNEEDDEEDCPQTEGTAVDLNLFVFHLFLFPFSFCCLNYT